MSENKIYFFLRLWEKETEYTVGIYFINWKIGRNLGAKEDKTE